MPNIDELDNLINEENIPKSNWFSFQEVGDEIKGVVEDVYIKKGTDDFQDQRVFALRLKDGEVWNVGVKTSNNFIMMRTNKVAKGDLLGLKFEKEIPPSRKGYKPAKSITPYIKYTEEGNKAREDKALMGE